MLCLSETVADFYPNYWNQKETVLQLFRYDIHDKMICIHCQKSGEEEEEADVMLNESTKDCVDEEDIGGFAGSWGHHSSPNTVPDTNFQASIGDEATQIISRENWCIWSSGQYSHRIILLYNSTTRFPNQGDGPSQSPVLTKQVLSAAEEVRQSVVLDT
ncbi:hypothetical protein L2E82_50293 [Cichorium intybus]|nr:hypothetical protein L2E82_50293 [Cichorium intybus]